MEMSTSTNRSMPNRDAPTIRPPDASMNQALRNKWRKRLFAFWIVGSLLVVLYLAIAGPLSDITGRQVPHVALIVVPFLILMMASGLAWLGFLVRSRR
jgi:uncharacterized membrane protein